MDSNIELLRRSFQHLLVRKEVFAKRFYNELFSAMPHLRAIFGRTDFESQRLHFVRALEIVVSLADERDNLVNFAKSSGARHVQYGASPFDMAAAIPLILDAMGDLLGPSGGWTDACKAAWADVLWTVISAMREGAASVEYEELFWDEAPPARHAAPEQNPQLALAMGGETQPESEPLAAHGSNSHSEYLLHQVDGTLPHVPGPPVLDVQKLLVNERSCD